MSDLNELPPDAIEIDAAQAEELLAGVEPYRLTITLSGGGIPDDAVELNLRADELADLQPLMTRLLDTAREIAENGQ